MLYTLNFADYASIDVKCVETGSQSLYEMKQTRQRASLLEENDQHGVASDNFFENGGD